jgi:hypothetical protein
MKFHYIFTCFGIVFSIKITYINLHVNNGHQKGVLCSSRRRLRNNYHNLSIIEILTIKTPIPKSNSEQSVSSNTYNIDISVDSLS